MCVQVELSERYVGSGNGQSQQSAMKLMELGPRLSLELFKVERGMCEGDVLFHKFEHKTPAEAAALKSKVEGAKQLKEERRRVQEENVKRKREEAEALQAAEEGAGGGKKPRRGLEAWAKNKKETFASDSEEEQQEGGVQYSDEDEEEGGEDYYSDSDADA
jgi:ribosome biogenesis protein SSF1/2